MFCAKTSKSDNTTVFPRPHVLSVALVVLPHLGTLISIKVNNITKWFCKHPHFKSLSYGLLFVVVSSTERFSEFDRNLTQQPTIRL